MSNDAILDQVFPVRSRAVLALRAPASSDDAATFQALATEAKNVAAAFGRAPAAKRWEAFAAALDIARLLVEWEQASLTAAIDADRFLRAARLRLKQLRTDAGSDALTVQLLKALSVLDGDIEFSAIRTLRDELAAIPIPVAVYADPVPQLPDWAPEHEQTQEEKLPDLTVAFVEFKINGTPAERVQALRPRENHDLDIAVRVSRWPEGATSLVLSPVSIEPASTYDLPTFRFSRPAGEAPYFFQQRGRMILNAPQALKARPFEFIYTAEFQPVSSEKLVSVAGQRTLRLDGSSPDRQPITGYPGIDAKLISLRDALRLEPRIPERDLDDLLAVLLPLSNLMGQSVQDNKKFPGVISEAEFQNRVREWLRQHPAIGSELEEQPHAAGGRADLSFRGIRIELKCEPAKRLLPDDCKNYAGQPASYAVGTNRRVAVLCVLDCSPKTDLPFPMEDGLFVYPVDTGTSPVYIAAVLIQGNLAKPSSHSR
jgi:hypothetical protein